MNITNTIWRNCHAHPDRAAFLYGGRSISYKALYATVERASARLAAAGIVKGNVVGLAVSHRISYVLTLLSALRLGAVVTPLGPEHRDELIAKNGIESVVLDNGDSWRSDRLPPSRLIADSMFLGAPSANEHIEVPPVVQGLESEPWMISMSSGTTGLSKSIVHTHMNGMLTASLSVRPNQEDQERTLVFVALGIYHGISRVMRQLYAGNTTILSRALDPGLFFSTVQRDRPTRVLMTTGTAASLVAYAEKGMPESAVACASIRSMMVSGGTVSPGLRKRITAAICPRLEVLYGATEAGTLAYSTPESHAAHPGSAGRLASWVQAEAVDENDQPLPPGKTGVLRFRSPLVTNGYLGDPEATEQAFRNGWFYPGDIGAVGPAGYLFLGGRVDQVLNVGGNKVHPGPIEALLNQDPAITDSAVVGIDDKTGRTRLVAAVEANDALDSEGLKRTVLERLGKIYVPAVIVRVRALPRNAAGKVVRSVLTKRIAKMAQTAATTKEAATDPTGS